MFFNVFLFSLKGYSETLTQKHVAVTKMIAHMAVIKLIAIHHSLE